MSRFWTKIFILQKAPPFKKINIMNRLKSALLPVCCLMILNGCHYEEKRMIDPAAQVASERIQSGFGGQLSDAKEPGGAARSSAPVQEADLAHGSVQQVEKTGVNALEANRPAFSVEYVTGRISEYNKKMDRWRERDSQAAVVRVPADESEKMVRCFRELQKVLNGYNRLQEILLQQPSLPKGGSSFSVKEMVELQQSDIAFVDGFCGQSVASDEVKGAGWVKSDDPAVLSPFESMIAQYSTNGQYEDLVQAWKKAPQVTTSRVRLQAKLLYGNALMALQREEEAVKVFRQIVDQMTPPDGMPTDLLSLRKTLADLYTAVGNYKDAEAQYIEISKEYKNMVSVEEWAILQRSILQRGEQGGPELKEYSDILKNYLGFNPAKDGYALVWQADKFLQSYPKSPVASNVDLIRTAVRGQADKWSKKTGVDTEGFAEQKRNKDVSGKEEAAPKVVVGSEVQQQVVKMSGDKSLAQKIESEVVKLENNQELERQWNEGVRLMEGQQYDKALEVFTPMLTTGYAAKAEKKIAEASLLAAEADRRRAADVFVRFTKTPDVESRKKLLVESRRILSDILVKYPGVDITEKVVGNIKRVENEMNAIDPGLVRQYDRVGGGALKTGGAMQGNAASGGQSPALK
jgi:tetratricopeptide (TPR) repeat protein